MIRHLVLNNLVLVDSCEIHFGPSFSAVTGETGAGKTALIEAIALCLGARADTTLIRTGCERAYVEVCFDIQPLVKLKTLLEDSGLSCDKGGDLVIRREISKEGKNRAFVNCRMTPLPLLQKIGLELIDRVGQHAHEAFHSPEAERTILDLSGDLAPDSQAFRLSYTQEKELQENLERLQQRSLRCQREEDHWRLQLEEIESANLKKGEEETVYEKYQKLAHAQELSEKMDLILTILSEGPSAALPQLSKAIKTCEGLGVHDKLLSDVSTLLHESHVALSEAIRSLQSCSQNLESSPNTFQHLENRLSAIAKLKRKYGQTWEEIDAYAQTLKTELSDLDNLSEELKIAERLLHEVKVKTNGLAETLSSKRKAAAEKLQTALTAQLQDLNMRGAEVTIEISSGSRTSSGGDSVQFWLRANTGQDPCRVRDHASGGELARLHFATKIVLAEKNETPTLIFDEIDANVGGRTATIIGEKLSELGRHRQVICITHFPQVASQAEEHFSVQKSEVEGRTLTQIKPLSSTERKQELLRMLGGKEIAV